MTFLATAFTQTVAGWFLRPADAALDRTESVRVEARPVHRTARRPLPAALALITTGRGARGQGAALALASSAGSGVALVACWGCAGMDGATGGPGLPAARRLVSSVRARGVTARACGRLVLVALASEDAGAIEELRRAEAAAASVGIACTLVLAAPRGPAWDAVLADRDLVLVHGLDDALADFAVDRLRDAGLTAGRLDPPPGLAARALAVRGLAPPGTTAGLRRAWREAT